MKKFFTILLLFCLLFTINNSAISQEADKNKKLLKIGVLLPLSGEYEILGNSFFIKFMVGKKFFFNVIIGK